MFGRGAPCAVHLAASVGGLGTGVVSLGFVELVFEGDDAAGGVDGRALVDEVPYPRSDAQLVAGVAAVPAGGALRGDQPAFVEAAQEILGDAEHLGGAAHGVAGVVLVIESVGHGRGRVVLGRDHSTSTSQGT